MFYAVSDGHGLPHDPFKAIVTPRPIGWITAGNRKGEINLSPYSFFNAGSDNPHMVAFSSDGRKDAVPLVPLGGGEPRYFMVIGQVIGIHIDDRFLVDGLLDTAAMRPIARAGYREYFVSTPET